MSINIYTDGGSRGNPGPAACAFVIYNDAGVLREKRGKHLGIATNNYAEYHGVILALKYLNELNDLNEIKSINFFLDSLLVVSQLNGKWKIKDENIKNLAEQIKLLLSQFSIPISFTHIPREKNKEADLLVNQTLDNL